MCTLRNIGTDGHHQALNIVGNCSNSSRRANGREPMTANAANDESDVVVSAEAHMEEGLARNDDSIPMATAVVAQPVTSIESSLTTHALTGSNRFIPVAVASTLANCPPLSPSSQSLPEQAEEERPDLLSATVYKRSPRAQLGIVLMNTDSGGVAVKRIVPESPFASSAFKPGDQVMSINSESCVGFDATRAADLIRNADSIVTVVVRTPNGRADMVSSMVMKKSRNARVGIGFRRNQQGKLVVSSIAENGVFAHSLLNASDTCLEINGHKCTPDMDATAAAALIQASPSIVTIKAKTRHETGVVVAVSTTSSETLPANVPVEVTSSQAQQQQGPTVAQKRKCFCIASFIAVFIIVMVVIVSNNEQENDDDWYPSCDYMNCTICGHNCYNASTNLYEYCCTEESYYSCTGSCPCMDLYCNVCSYKCYNTSTFQYDYCCSEELTYTCSGACPTVESSAPTIGSSPIWFSPAAIAPTDAAPSVLSSSSPTLPRAPSPSPSLTPS